MLKAHSEKREYRHKKKDLKLMKKVCFQLNFDDSFEDIFLKWDGNEFQSDGPGRAI